MIIFTPQNLQPAREKYGVIVHGRRARGPYHPARSLDGQAVFDAIKGNLIDGVGPLGDEALLAWKCASGVLKRYTFGSLARLFERS
jgi:hypothetical protein